MRAYMLFFIPIFYMDIQTILKPLIHLNTF